jgi:hypothetical protein
LSAAAEGDHLNEYGKVRMTKLFLAMPFNGGLSLFRQHIKVRTTKKLFFSGPVLTLALD